jgi:hypothetical protein
MKDLLYQKFLNKKINSKKEEIEFYLTFDEFKQLVQDANITVDDLHIKGYHLARYNDSGNYEIGNCRFIPYLDNYKERKISDRNRLASKQNILNYNLSLSAEEKSERANRIAKIRKQNGNLVVPDNSLTDDEIKDRISVINRYDTNQRGWITKCSNELGISHTQLRRFINKHIQGVV